MAETITDNPILIPSFGEGANKDQIISLLRKIWKAYPFLDKKNMDLINIYCGPNSGYTGALIERINGKPRVIGYDRTESGFLQEFQMEEAKIWRHTPKV